MRVSHSVMICEKSPSKRCRIRSGNEIREIKWCSGKDHLADCMTKRGASGYNLLNVSSGICDQLRFKLVCSATEAS